MLCNDQHLTFEMLNNAVKKNIMSNFDVTEENNITPLHLLCANPNLTLAMFRLVVDNKIKFYQQLSMKTDNFQNTYLHYICANPNVDPDVLLYCQKLNWTNYDFINSKYQTPYQLLCQHTNHPNFTYLLHIGYNKLTFPVEGILIPKYTDVSNDWIVKGITVDTYTTPRFRLRLRTKSM